MSGLLPAVRVEYLIQPRMHCGLRSYAVAGKNNDHVCGTCGERVLDSGEPWEMFTPDVTPKRPA